MKVSVDARRCEGTGFCAAVAPALFALEGDPPAVALVDEVPAGAEDGAREAEQMCPVRAILVED